MDKRIRQILAEDMESRSNDKRLILRVWESYGFYLTPQQQYKFMNLPSTESIRRTRQRIQELGLYPASNYVKRQRKFKSMQVQQMMPKTKPENVEKLVQKPMFDLPNEFRQI